MADFRVLFDFRAEDGAGDEMSVKVDDIVTMAGNGDHESGDGWVNVRGVDGVSGFVPRDYLAPLSETVMLGSPSNTNAPSSSSGMSPISSTGTYLDVAPPNEYPNEYDAGANSDEYVEDEYAKDAIYMGGEKNDLSVLHHTLDAMDDDDDDILNSSTLYELAAEKGEPAALYMMPTNFEEQTELTELNETSASASEISIDTMATNEASKIIPASSFLKINSHTASTDRIQHDTGDNGSCDADFNRGRGVKPTLINSAERDDFVGLANQLDIYFSSISVQQIETESFLENAEVLSTQVNESLKSSNQLLAKIGDVSDTIDASRSKLMLQANKMRSKSVFMNTAKILESL